MGRLWERIYPIVLAFVVSLILYLFDFTPKMRGFEKVLDGVITFASIVIGFLAALLAIILSISKSKVMKHLYEHIDIQKGKNILFGFFKQSIGAGFIVVIFSICMYLIHHLDVLSTFNKIIFWLWTYFSLFFLLSAYRIINVLMTALFLDAKSSFDSKPKQSNVLNPDELDEFKRSSSRQQ